MTTTPPTNIPCAPAPWGPKALQQPTPGAVSSTTWRLYDMEWNRTLLGLTPGRWPARRDPSGGPLASTTIRLVRGGNTYPKRPAGVKGASQGVTIQHGQPTRAAAKWARAMANSVEAKPTVIDWDKAIAHLLDILDDIYERRG